jgi:hypothetical protein
MEDSIIIGLIALIYSLLLLAKVWKIASNSSKQIEISLEILRRSQAKDPKNKTDDKPIGFGFASDDQLIQHSGKK